MVMARKTGIGRSGESGGGAAREARRTPPAPPRVHGPATVPPTLYVVEVEVGAAPRRAQVAEIIDRSWAARLCGNTWLGAPAGAPVNWSGVASAGKESIDGRAGKNAEGMTVCGKTGDGERLE